MTVKGHYRRELEKETKRLFANRTYLADGAENLVRISVPVCGLIMLHKQRTTRRTGKPIVLRKPAGDGGMLEMELMEMSS